MQLCVTSLKDEHFINDECLVSSEPGVTSVLPRPLEGVVPFEADEWTRLFLTLRTLAAACAAFLLDGVNRRVGIGERHLEALLF